MSLLRFEPLFKERVWGGRRLAELYNKQLPPGPPIGEAWEIVDRPEAQSVVRAGRHAGRTLGELWRSEERTDLFGTASARWGDRFPLLIKLLDAEDVLSVQVHPPAARAAGLGGEPKTEMWFIADARPGAHLLAGLRAGTGRAQFEAALLSGEDVGELLHRIDVQPGDAIFIPSGRVHAIGPGNLIVEVQQNSDTTYRVYDFGRMGLDGVPRELHVEQSLQSIDFDDIEPGLQVQDGECVVACEFFDVRRVRAEPGVAAADEGQMAILAALSGEVSCGGEQIAAGEFVLVPATEAGAELAGGGELLRISLPR